MKNSNNIIRVKGDKIVDPSGRPLTLKGINLGGWLMMEGYIMHSPNIGVHRFKNSFAKKLSNKELKELELSFRKAFIKEQDIKAIADLGLNCIRVPFNYRLLEKAPYSYNLENFVYIDNVIKWAKNSNIKVMLDMHAAPGSQNYDWHSDSCGKAKLFSSKVFRNRTYALWEFIADRYKDNDTVVGYNVLNEPFTDKVKILNEFYSELIRRIRKVDKNHILFIEGNLWSTDIKCLQEFDDDNYCLSIHNYEPFNFAFNLIPHLKYPLKEKGLVWNKAATKELLLKHKKISRERKVPIFVGEFGVNNRQGYYGEDKWLDDLLGCFKELGFHWTYWTYKAVKNSKFPDGLFSYYPNPEWVSRHGPLQGWDNYHLCWRNKKKEIVQSWDTGKFTISKPIEKVLKKYVK